MKTHTGKREENKNQSVANGVSLKQGSSKSRIQLIDNRSETLAKRKLQELATNSNRSKQAIQLQIMTNKHVAQQQFDQKKENQILFPETVRQKAAALIIQYCKSTGDRNIVQRGKRLKDASKKLNMSQVKKTENRRMFRTLMLNRLRNKKYIKRNKLAFTLNVKGLNVTIHLDSRGLGGKHPMYKQKSSAHTEQIVRAVIASRKKDLVKILNRKLTKHKKATITDYDGSVELTSIVSSNSPCNTNAGDHDHGCGGIPTEELGMSKGLNMGFVREYQGEDKEADITDYEAMRQFAENAKKLSDFKDEESSDEELDTEYLRGKDIATTPLKSLQSPDVKKHLSKIKSGKNEGQFRFNY